MQVGGSGGGSGEGRRRGRRGARSEEVAAGGGIESRTEVRAGIIRAWEAMQRVTDEETAWRAGRERRGRGRSVEAGERERG